MPRRRCPRRLASGPCPSGSPCLPVCSWSSSWGLAGSLLSVRWAGDSYNASVVNQRLIARTLSTEKEKPLPASVAPPEPSWWQTTALHLAQWGVYLGRAGSAEDSTGEARDLLEAAIRISPINPTARLARAQLGGQSAESAGPAWNLGLSRDAVSLAFSARASVAAGKKAGRDPGLRTGPPDCLPASTSRRWPTWVSTTTPAFAAISCPGRRPRLRSSASLPPTPTGRSRNGPRRCPGTRVAMLAAARLLREQGKPEAQKLLEQILDEGQEGSTGDDERDRAIRLAMRAEAHALLSQWDEAEQRYRQAIDRIQDPTIKRSWWFNLASIASQLNDEAQRKAALAAALDVAASDDISRRALELQRASQPLVRLRSGGTRAN